MVTSLLGRAAWGALVLSLNSLDSLVLCFLLLLFLNFLCCTVSLLLHGLFSRCGERGLVFFAVLGLLTVTASLAAKRRL